LYGGQGIGQGGEVFESRGVRPLALDTGRKLTGTFAVTTPYPVEVIGVDQTKDAVGYVAADFVIWVGRTRLGPVHVEGAVSPTKPIVRTFALSLPREVGGWAGVMAVTVNWVSCVGPIGCAIRVSGSAHSRLTFPTR
jgi:hypothetical protein